MLIFPKECEIDENKGILKFRINN